VRAELQPGGEKAAQYVFNGARTFLSAAFPKCEQGSDLLPVFAKHVAADRNVRAPR
jgi:hypothetical protein